MNIESIAFKNMSFFFEGAEVLFAKVNYTFPKARVIKISAKHSGKSTLLKILAGILPVSEGSYLINGQDVAEMSFEEFLPIRKKIGYGFDVGGLLNNKTLLENILLPLQYHNYSGERIETRVQTLLERFKLERLQHLRPFSVPGSLRKAACLARAFIHEPDILLLDEPDAGLKDEGLMNLCHTIEESLEKYGLKQVIYVSDSPLLEKRLGPEEVMIDITQFGPTMRKAA